MCSEYKKDAPCPLCLSALTEQQMINGDIPDEDDDMPSLVHYDGEADEDDIVNDDMPPLVHCCGSVNLTLLPPDKPWDWDSVLVHCGNVNLTLLPPDKPCDWDWSVDK